VLFGDTRCWPLQTRSVLISSSDQDGGVEARCASFAAGRRAAAFGRVARLLVGERLLGLIVVGLATLLGRFWP
jgi:hypothetical protein